MFRVGDIITGSKESNNKYLYTNEYGMYKVVKIENYGYIIIEIIKYPRMAKVGERFRVQAKYFTKVYKQNYIGETDEI